MSDEQTTARQFAELEDKVRTAEAKLQQFAEQARAANERVYILEVERQRKQFAEEAENLHTVPVDKYVSFMEALDGEQRDAARDLIGDLARRIEASEPYVFKTHGIRGRGAASTEGEIAARITALRAANPKLTQAQAYAEVLEADPTLYERALTEQG